VIPTMVAVCCFGCKNVGIHYFCVNRIKQIGV
jgi:hypothetical protein